MFSSGSEGAMSPERNAGRQAGSGQGLMGDARLCWAPSALGPGGDSQHTPWACRQADRHPRAHAAATWLSFIRHGPAAAEGQTPASHSQHQAAAQLGCCAQCRRREQPFHCCCCRLASPGSSWRCHAEWRAPLCKQNPAPVWPSQLQGRRGAMEETLGASKAQCTDTAITTITA